ncbi:MAG: methionyl-tRNA formyltransferase [Oscillospiraceae bacterium]|nr:methionyl-tRNA formyltransferase [Oscillospiraceae bacterium]
MDIVFMGTPDFAVPSLERLTALGHRVKGVFTQPDKPVGRKQEMTAPPVKQLAQSHGIPVFQPVKMRDGTALRQLQELRPELVVVVAYGRILPPELLAVPKYGCINIHGSLLPRYRGAAPIQWTVINGDAEAGVTSMYMAEGLDTGDMLLKLSTPVGEEETAGELFDRLAPLGADCLEQTLALLEGGLLRPEPQREEDATLAPMLDKAMARLDFTREPRELCCLVRGLNPWPVAYTGLDGKKLKIYAARPAEGFSGEAGTLLEDSRMIVAAGSGAVELLRVQLEGSKQMDAAEFLRGRHLEPGKKFIAP